MVGRERGQGQSGFAGELPENGHEEGEGTWTRRIQWSESILSGWREIVNNGWVGVTVA
jgi:hypothetical protein